MGVPSEVSVVELHDVDLVAQVVGAPFAQGLRVNRGSTARDSYRDINELACVEQQPLSDNALKWALFVVVASFIDSIGSGVIMFVAFKYGYRDSGSSLYSIGILALSHLASSLLLVLRFLDELWSTGAAGNELREQRRISLHREQAITVGMAAVMLVTGCGLLFKAFRKISSWEEFYPAPQRHHMGEELKDTTAWLAWTGFVNYALQAILRFSTSYIVHISVVTHGWVASFVTFIFMLVLGAAAKNESEWSWKAEPIAAIVLVCVTMVEAIRIIFTNVGDVNARLMERPLV
eukprot:TRINITY_DN16281_c0_g1_i1.p1 TRINITY_DN16281_c0_g1~~TRINITY_DN16281_c0_g1_i1.p1  ORF type:complete len:291 (+),score=42.00 TRINITY_DN16281_c0_g1_i1:48-920(+)